MMVSWSAAGCAAAHATTAPSPDTWSSVLATAQGRATTGKFDSADSILASYAAHNASTQGALESSYWRALFLMDPTNPHASLTAATASLDGYLNDPRPHEHAVEAIAVRRVVTELDGLNKTAANALAQAKDANLSAKDAKAQADARAEAAKATDVAQSSDEVKRLKDELAKANAELERIRKRLTPPPPARL